MTDTIFSVEDMHCGACVQRLRGALRDMSGIDSLHVNPVRKRVVVGHDQTLPIAEIVQRLEGVGFHPALIQADNARSDLTDWLKRIGVAGIAMAQVMMIQVALYGGAFDGMTEGVRRLLEFWGLLFCIPVVTYAAVPFYRGLYRLKTEGITMDTPIALAIVVAFSVSLHATLTGRGEVYYDSVVMFTFLLLVARYIERQLRSRLAVEDNLLASLPRSVWVIEAGTEQTLRETPLADVLPGQRVWVGEGEMVPFDGTVYDASALLNEAMLTGESEPSERLSGQTVYAGSMNAGAAFAIEVNARPQDSRMANLEVLANQALEHKSGIKSIADKVACWFLPGVIVAAFGTWLWWQMVDPSQAISAALAVLVVSCPCALSLAVPAAFTSAMTKLRQAGVVVRSRRALEEACRVDRVVFDKTGTLTMPNQSARVTQSLGSTPSEVCLQYATALARCSNHPLSRAFNGSTPYGVVDPQIIVGKGVSGTVDGRVVRFGSAEFCDAHGIRDDALTKHVYLSIDGHPAAEFEIPLDLRGDAQATVAALKQQDLIVSILSGDTDAQCRPIADQLGVEYEAAAMPEDKARVLGTHPRTLYVGDGINDLPALASSTLSATTLETTDLVKSHSDIVLMSKRLTSLLDLLKVGKAFRRVLKQNVIWAVLYNLTAIPLAALGYFPPWVAALGMSASSLLVIGNAARLLRLPLIPLSERNSAS